MASGPLLEGVVDGSRENRRWVESKVYTRKIHNKATKPIQNQNPHPPSSSQTLVTTIDDTNSSLQPLTSENRRPLAPHHQSSATSVEDACSLNRQPVADHNLYNGQNRSITINLASKTKHEVRVLRKTLTTDLELVRSLARKLEARQLQLSLNDGHKTAPAIDFQAPFLFRKEQAVSEASLAAIPSPPRRHQLNVLLPAEADPDNAIGDSIQKEKRTPKANQFYKNTDFLLGKDKFPTQDYSKKSNVNVNKSAMRSRQNKFYEPAFKKCGVLLSKLMKHHHGWIFNSPVDADDLGLLDYHRIIRHPMDLGTVESRLNKNCYRSPMDFAEDVRLTFHNALTYNPKGDEVYLMAEQLLQIFEERWPVIEADLAYLRSPPPLKRPPPLDTGNSLERSDSTVLHSEVDLNMTSLNQTTHIGRSPVSKKPKARDPNKREMTYDEKQRLGDSLQKLPMEKLNIVVQIIRKRNFSLSQHEDEIEVDIDSVDTETLWELDRFLTNYKKSLNKKKRKEALAFLARAETEQFSEHRDQRMVSDAVPPGSLKGNMTVQVAKEIASSPLGAARIGHNGSRSSCSSSSTSDSGSTSSGSDTKSSSRDRSDAAQSPAT
ncbi:Transcription factor GTE4 [Platanthera guangdongensis]|uniref:Transcription factor GTE4 n=1 Tax=Platanthera guangdongensis TaxID=2320717 RepID=A0ABR2LDT5_9ASPA